MGVETLTTPRSSLPNTYTNITAREIDFVSRFGRNVTALRNVLGIARPIKKEDGTRLVSYTADVSLESGSVDPGCVIPYSKATIAATVKADVSVEKYAKAVPIEDVKEYGAEVAITKSDDAFLTKLQNKVTSAFYTFLLDDTAAMTATYSTWKMAVAMAIGKVRNKFQSMDRDITDVVVFVNTLDAYEYLGGTDVTVQTAFGLSYIENFLGAKTMILSDRITSGKVVAIPSDNIVLYYVDPADSDFARLGLEYRTDGDTNLIGFHAQGNYSTAVGESFALMGMTLWAEFADGVALITVSSNPLSALTLSPAGQGVTMFDTQVSAMQKSDVAVTGNKITGTLKYLATGSPATTWGAGNFLALAWSNIDSDTTSLRVGLVPSAGSGLVECLSDPDHNGYFKITDKNTQKFVTIQTDGDGNITKQEFDLSGLVLETE